MTRRWLIILSLSLSALTAVAREQLDCDTDSPVEAHVKNVLKVTDKLTCPNSTDTQFLCSAVSGMLEDKDPNSNYSYKYERIIYEASCVDIVNDSEKVISQKVNKMWQKYGSSFTCNSTQFDVTDGSILKFVIKKKFSDFLFDAAQVWKIDLNQVDESDGRTLVDYVEKEIRRNKGNANEPVLKQYLKVLVDAGAKRRSEL
jgi:hypothetical protein